MPDFIPAQAQHCICIQKEWREAGQSRDLPARFEIEQQRIAPFVHRETTAIWREGHSEEARTAALEAHEFLSSVEIPDPHRRIVARRGEPRAVSRHRNAVQLAFVPEELRDLFSSEHVPNGNFSAAMSARDLRSIRPKLRRDDTGDSLAPGQGLHGILHWPDDKVMAARDAGEPAFIRGK